MKWNPFGGLFSGKRNQDFETDPESGRQYTTVPLTADVEALAEQLLANSLPPFFLDDIDLTTDEGKAQFLFTLMSRRNFASLERDEVVRFVQRNRAALRGDAKKLIADLREASLSVEGGNLIGDYLDYLMPQVDHALNGHPEKIDVKSDRLLWLVFAASQALSHNLITYDRAREILSQPEHRARISPVSLMFMLHDYVGTIGEAQQPPPENVLLIVECGLLSDDVSAVRAGLGVLSQLASPKNPVVLLDLDQRVREFFARHDVVDKDIEKWFGQVRQRHDIASDDDL